MSFEIDAGGPPGLLKFKPWVEMPWLVHGFTTRATGDFSSLARAEQFQAALAVDGMRLVSVHQVHSDVVYALDIDVAPPPGVKRPEADGLMSHQPGHLLGVRTADCLPLLYVDRERPAVAAVHAGWRGTAKSIAARAVERMEKEFGSQPRDLEVVIGPGIGPCCYEVGPEVAEQFEPAVIRQHHQPHLDLGEANRLQLVRAGVSPSRIRPAGMCTACDTERFHSYRREGAGAGRMLAVVGIRP